MNGARGPGRHPPPVTRDDALDLVALLQQMERRPEIGGRLLHALEQLLQRDDPASCLELARRYAGRPIRSHAEAKRWVRQLHRKLAAGHRVG